MTFCLLEYRDNLVDNFSKHKDEVEKILAEGVKKL
jgi:homogentisate 1,2-dioxygenase